MYRDSVHSLLLLSLLLCGVCRRPYAALALEGGSDGDGDGDSDGDKCGGGEGVRGVVESHQEVTSVLREMLQVLHDREQHTKLYERVALLEDQLRQKEQQERKLQETVLQQHEKMTQLEAKVLDIPKFSERLDELEDRVTKNLHEYESKLSAMGAEVIRLKHIENKLVAMSQSLLQIKAKPIPKDSTLTKGFSLLAEKEPTKTGLIAGLVSGSGFECPLKDPEVLAAFIGGQCFYFPQGPPMDWTSAQRHCHALGGALATPRDIWPLRRYLDTSPGNIESVWLGGTYQASSGDWQWSGGEKSELPPFFKTLATGTSLSNPLEEEAEEGEEDENVSRNFALGVLTHVSRHRLSLRGYSSSLPDPHSSSASSSQPSASSSVDRDAPPPLLKNLVEVGGNGNSDEDEEQQKDQNPQKLNLSPRCLLLHKNNSLHSTLIRASCTEHHHYVCKIDARRPIDITSLLTQD